MAECTLPSRTFQAAEDCRPLQVDSELAREWSLATGRATLADGDLRPAENLDSVSEAIVHIGNSERPAEDFNLVYKIIARANSSVATLSRAALATMVEAVAPAA